MRVEKGVFSMTMGFLARIWRIHLRPERREAIKKRKEKKLISG